MDNYSSQAADLVNSMGVAIANWSTAMAVASVRWLIASLGQSTEPDLTVIVPVYNRMLAISLLIVGAVIALALIERIAWSSQGAGLSLIPRVLASCFFAYAGLGAVKYVAGYEQPAAGDGGIDVRQVSPRDRFDVRLAEGEAQ